MILWPEKGSFNTRILSRFPSFFNRHTWCLCSRDSGHTIGISSQIITSSSDTVARSHSHFPTTELILCLNSPTLLSPVKFTSSLTVIRTYPLFSANTSWKDNSYIPTSIPLRKPKTSMDDVSEFITSNALHLWCRSSKAVQTYMRHRSK
ncbi:hypothetical protein C8R41DRAFT_415522 [Lentinula lateritia]|uniref:Uncharacterized protein n=1 Tax=Lentinula lateritia TaxID=40482 RepID=A0ABQ8VC87_9AGAR|nr:hypothetical protein C8R41DRAFT_415522 [Lentinula lateritia]